MENFSENVLDQIPANPQHEQFHYRQQEQEKEEDELRNAVIKQQKGLKNYILIIINHSIIILELQKKNVEVVPTLKFRAEIKKLALTLYLGTSDLVSKNSLVKTRVQYFLFLDCSSWTT